MRTAKTWKKGQRIIVNLHTKNDPEYFIGNVTSVKSGKVFVEFDDGDTGKYPVNSKKLQLGGPKKCKSEIPADKLHIYLDDFEAMLGIEKDRGPTIKFQKKGKTVVDQLANLFKQAREGSIRLTFYDKDDYVVRTNKVGVVKTPISLPMSAIKKEIKQAIPDDAIRCEFVFYSEYGEESAIDIKIKDAPIETGETYQDKLESRMKEPTGTIKTNKKYPGLFDVGKPKPYFAYYKSIKGPLYIETIARIYGNTIGLKFSKVKGNKETVEGYDANEETKKQWFKDWKKAAKKAGLME